MTPEELKQLSFIPREAHPDEIWRRNVEYVRLDDALEAIKTEREACAKVAENGRFLSDDAPDAKFGKACAEAIRRRS